MRLFTLLSCLIFLFGCSSRSSNPFGNAYQNTTARYNAFFIANEEMKAIEKKVYGQYTWNYNKILPVFPQFDTTFSSSIATDLKECVEKASIAIQRHVGSKWEDDSYLLVGKARYFGSEFQDAVETFKYVNKKSKDNNTRHEALVLLLRTFTEIGEFNNAIAVSDFLKREQLNERNQRELFATRAYLFQKREDLNQMVQNLVKAEEIMPSSPDKARIEFIIGQVYQQLGFDAEAYNYYEKCLGSSPTYELSFYTKLNMSQVTQLSKSGDIKRVEKYFKKLLRDPKNLEYKDKIYYEWAGFDAKQGDIENAIQNYKLSVRYSVKNIRQKAYSYLKLGQIYYDSLRDYQLAKAYYDSTVTTMPKDEEDFSRISQRQEILTQFVEQITTIAVNDSLLAISSLDKDSLYALAKKRVKEGARLAEEKKQKERIRSQATSFDNDQGELISAQNRTGMEWYFYNPSDLSRGSSEFKRTWGNRPLEDNWRRSKKAGQITEVEQRPEEQTTSKEDTPDKEDELEAEISRLLATVPQSESEKAKLQSEIEEAYYHLGGIYNFKLEEKTNAISTFETLLARFPKTEHRPEVLYQLYLLYNATGNSTASERASQLKSEFPESIFAKLVDNPNFREESQATTEKLKKLYNVAYRLYESDKLKEVVFLVDSALAQEPKNEFSDNLKLLAILATGKLEGSYKYQFELNNFKKIYPESELVPYVDRLIKTSEEYQISLVNSAKARFVKYFEQKHFLIVAYKNQAELSSSITKLVDEYVKRQSEKLTTGNLILDEDFAMILINDMEDRTSALSFLGQFSTALNFSESFKGEKIYTFVISQDNFNIFYKTKDLNAYLNFFDQNYSR